MPTMRDRFVHVSSQLLDERADIAVVLAEISLSNFKESGAVQRHPRRVVNVGIREQLLIGFAAGLAMEGIRPIVHTYSPFLIERPFEQVKLDFGHQDLGGVFVSAGGAFDAAPSGRTHQAPEDVVLISAIPGWRVHIPGHPDEVEATLGSAVAGTGRDYIRTSTVVNSRAFVRPGGFSVLRCGSDTAVTVIAVGPSLDPTLDATADLDATVQYASTVRPFDAETLRTVLAGPEIVLVEPCLVGTSAAEVSAALIDVPHRLLALGVPCTEHRHYGTEAEHRAGHGLDASGIRGSIAEFLAMSGPG